MAITRNVLIVFAFLSFMPLSYAGTGNLSQLQRALQLPTDSVENVVKEKFRSQSAELEIMALYAPNIEEKSLFLGELELLKNLYRAAFGVEPAETDVMDIELESGGSVINLTDKNSHSPRACERPSRILSTSRSIAMCSHSPVLKSN